MAELGTCQCCGEEKQLDARSLCQNCRTAQPCAVHEDLLTMQRCAFCRKPSCAYCLEERLCAQCREEGREAPERTERAKPKAKTVLSDADRANRKRLVMLGSVLAVAGGFNYWYFVGGPMSPEDVCKERLNTAQALTMEYAIHHRGLPKTLKEIRLAAKASKKDLPLMIPAGCKPVPNAVIYAYNGKHYEFQATMADGQLLKEDGKVMLVTAP